jgi:hypothetical protein
VGVDAKVMAAKVKRLQELNMPLEAKAKALLERAKKGKAELAQQGAKMKEGLAVLEKGAGQAAGGERRRWRARGGRRGLRVPMASGVGEGSWVDGEGAQGEGAARSAASFLGEPIGASGLGGGRRRGRRSSRRSGG